MESEWLSEWANLVKVGRGGFRVTHEDRLCVLVCLEGGKSFAVPCCAGRKGRYGLANRE
jgi:hypothetical protein